MKKVLMVIVVILLLSSVSVKAKSLENVTEITPKIKCSIDRDVDANIMAMQGVYFFSKYAVYTGYQADDAIGHLTLVDLEECKVIDINSEKVLGHGNDITYDSRNSTFYVTAGPASNKVYSFKITNNEIVYGNEINANMHLNCFTYDSDRERFFSYASNKVYTLPSLDSTSSDIVELNTVETVYDDVTFVPQGIAYSSDKIYFSRYINDNSNYVLIYDAETGDYQSALYIPKNVIAGEIEGITVIDNMLYLGYNSAGKQVFLEFELFKKNEEINSDEEENDEDNDSTPVSNEETVKVDNTGKQQGLILTILGILLVSAGVFLFTMKTNKKQIV